jgi:hypothetical protein
MQPLSRATLYRQLESLPEGIAGEILNGRLHIRPRPAGPSQNGSGLDVDSTLFWTSRPCPMLHLRN